jgi:hypothetical protein
MTLMLFRDRRMAENLVHGGKGYRTPPEVLDPLLVFDPHRLAYDIRASR